MNLKVPKNILADWVGGNPEKPETSSFLSSVNQKKLTYPSSLLVSIPGLSVKT
jgi:hypothetical protein